MSRFCSNIKAGQLNRCFLKLHFVSLYPWRKLASLLLQLYIVSLYHWRRFVFRLLQPFLCFTFLWQQYLLSFYSKRLICSQTSRDGCVVGVLSRTKKWMGKKGYFEGFGKSYFLDGIEKLLDRLTRCMELKGDYIEK